LEGVKKLGYALKLELEPAKVNLVLPEKGKAREEGGGTKKGRETNNVKTAGHQPDWFQEGVTQGWEESRRKKGKKEIERSEAGVGSQRKEKNNEEEKKKERKR